MATRPIVVTVICVGLFIVLELWVPKAAAQRTSNINGYRMENQRTHKRRNYMLQRARDKEILGSLDNVGVTYDMGPLDAGRNPEELPAFIVDYANMIDDVILLDKSVETRTRKRGNIKVEKHNNQAIPDPPCKCKSMPDSEDLGDNTFPRRVETRICDKDQQDGCVAPYACKETFYNVAVLKKRTLHNAKFSRDKIIPNNLLISWVSELVPVSVGCECQRDFTSTN